MGQDGRSDTTREHFRSRCSIARTLDIFGDKWTLLIVRDLLWHGKHTFGALHESAERIPTNILSDRLRRLETWGLVERRPYADRPLRHEYHLTARGRSLEDALLGVMAWGHAHLDGGFFDPRTGWSTPPRSRVSNDGNA
ncbi:winged helix-turn-helix transcriptional regulator [Aurantimonas manganoxydans]|nr:helix-turn-helix domain-containing protein [Aurantimonas manganoxydans]